jgi:hypothetical protein
MYRTGVQMVFVGNGRGFVSKYVEINLIYQYVGHKVITRIKTITGEESINQKLFYSCRLIQ